MELYLHFAYAFRGVHRDNTVISLRVYHKLVSVGHLKFSYVAFGIWSLFMTLKSTWECNTSRQFYTVGGHAVAQLVEALRYKPEGRGFDSRWCHWNFSLTYSFRPHYGPEVDSASNRNEYQEYFLGVKAAGA